LLLCLVRNILWKCRCPTFFPIFQPSRYPRPTKHDSKLGEYFLSSLWVDPPSSRFHSALRFPFGPLSLAPIPNSCFPWLPPPLHSPLESPCGSLGALSSSLLLCVPFSLLRLLALNCFHRFSICLFLDPFVSSCVMSHVSLCFPFGHFLFPVLRLLGVQKDIPITCGALPPGGANCPAPASLRAQRIGPDDRYDRSGIRRPSRLLYKQAIEGGETTGVTAKCLALPASTEASFALAIASHSGESRCGDWTGWNSGWRKGIKLEAMAAPRRKRMRDTIRLEQ
jgi:hypothetical protein